MHFIEHPQHCLRCIRFSGAIRAATTTGLLLFIAAWSSVGLTGNPYEISQSLIKVQQYDEAYRVLSQQAAVETDKDLKSLAHFGLGVISQIQKKPNQAILEFEESLKSSAELEDIVRFLKARSLRELGETKEAREEFNKAEYTGAKSGRVYLESEFELGLLDMADKKWGAAQNHFQKLEKRTRGDEKYSQVLFNLVKVELAKNRKWMACRWASKLYAKYPADPQVQGWGIDLQEAKVDDKPLACIASVKDQRTRIRNLQLQGRSAQAEQEIKLLQTRATALTKNHVDYMLASFYLSEGRVMEALTILLPYYKKDLTDPNFFQLLAKVAAQAGEFQMAVGAYQRVYELSRRSKIGRMALFQAAFLSYQFQDYDGSARKFEEFISKFPRSGLSRDAKWHLAWIRYLKGDYDGALAGFKEQSVVKVRRRHGGTQASTVDKSTYWMAMSLLKMGRTNEAVPIFEKLSGDKLLGFYSLAAQARLQALKDVARVLAASKKEDAKSDGDNKADNKKETPATALSTVANLAQENADTEENESEETTAATAPADEDADSDSDNNDAAVVATSEDQFSNKDIFQNVQLAKRFKRAGDLMMIGLNDWATWELYEIERKTSNPTHLKTLVTRYEQMDAFHRSAYIAQTFFSRSRAQLGLKGEGRSQWVSCYPRAFERSVTTFSRIFEVPEEFVWAIMRAESQFKAAAKSPVGALGLMQLMPFTADQLARLLNLQGYSTQQLFDPGVNIRLGSRYLQRLLKQFEGNIPLSAAAYNAGPHRVRSWIKSFGSNLEMDEFIEHIPYLETRNYVKKVVHNFYVYHLLFTKGAKKEDLNILAKPVGITIAGDVESKENWDKL